jgi:RimJ/RimL family protein N-acetyltransferase
MTGNLKKDIFLQGTTIDLRILQEKDIDGNYSWWLNDEEVTSYNSHGRFPITVENLRHYVATKSGSNTILVLAVIDKQTGAHIGNISLQDINWVNRSGEIAFLLGEKAYWGKGVMLEAGRMLLQHGFDMLNLHRIYCGTSAENTGMQKLAIKLGMQQEGLRKDALYKHGRFIDIIDYGMINPREREHNG